MCRVLARHASGISLEEIARESYCSPAVVYRAAKGLRKRLEVENLAQAALVAFQLGYLTLPDEQGIVLSQSPFGAE